MPDRSRAAWKARASGLRPRHQALIGGRFVDAASGETFGSVNPATGEAPARVAACDPPEVDRAVAAARPAVEGGAWSRAAPARRNRSRAAPARRKEVLLRLAGMLRDNLEELAPLDSLHLGKLVMDAATVDGPGSAAIFRWYAEAIDRLRDEVAPTGPGDLALIRRVPVGSVGAVTPWNFRLEPAAGTSAAALAAGNSAVLEPAERSPLSALRLGELAPEAGLPEGVLNVVPGPGAAAGRALGLRMDVDAIASAGSTATGKLFMEYPGRSNLKAVRPETGGKSPDLVFADCRDLGRAADMAAFGILSDLGEVCSANRRLSVERSIRDGFVERLVDRAGQAQPGDPIDPASPMGAMVDGRQTRRIMSFIEGGRRTARLVAGGERVRLNGAGRFVAPRISDEVGPQDPLAREEIFGPVLSVIPFDSEEEAVRMAGDSPCGLAASVRTGDLGRAPRAADALHAGTVAVNTVDARSVQAPFGGMRQSGFGRDLSQRRQDK